MTDDTRKAIRIVVADKSPLVQTGLTAFFENNERFCHVSTVPNGSAFMDASEKLQFNIGVIGWDMPGLNGRDVLQAIRKFPNPPRIVIYTGNAAPDIPRQAMQLGGAGFCSKSEPMSILLETVIAVSEGRMVFPFMDMSAAAADPYGTLTAREQELLASLSRGCTNAQLAKEFDISLNTVKFHLKNLFSKLAVKNRAQAVSRYLKSHGGMGNSL